MSAFNPPIKRCVECGRERPCYRARSERPLCTTCYRRHWRPPPGVCTICHRERPCHHAGTDRAVCPSCLRGLLLEPCAVCGKTAKVVARSKLGPMCPTCNYRAHNTTICCARCERVARPALQDRSICRACADEPAGPSCRSCGASETSNYADGRCPRCILCERLNTLAEEGNPAAVAQLRPYLAALRDGPQPRTVLGWMRYSTSYRTLTELVAGTVALSHEALDEIDRGPSTVYLRAALVRHGALPRRQEGDAFAPWLAREIARLPDSEDRTHLRTFATWQVQRDLQLRGRRGQTTRSSRDLARTRVKTAAALIRWLHAQDLTLIDLRQHQVDAWLADGATTRWRVRAFIEWARPRGVVGAIEVPRLRDRDLGDALDDEERLAIVRRLLSDATIDLRDRVAGCLVLVFAQAISRLLLLRTDDVQIVDATVALRFGSQDTEIPEPLGALVLALKADPRGLASTGAAHGDGWLFPGALVGSPMSTERMQRRLKTLGISGRSGRGSALMRLAREIPAPILADLLGIHENTAAGWTRAAGGEWARYAADGSSRYDTLDVGNAHMGSQPT